MKKKKTAIHVQAFCGSGCPAQRVPEDAFRCSVECAVPPHTKNVFATKAGGILCVSVPQVQVRGRRPLAQARTGARVGPAGGTFFNEMFKKGIEIEKKLEAY